MNRRSFVRWLGLAPTAAVLPLAGAQAIAAGAPGGPLIASTSINAGRITASKITTGYVQVTQANLGNVTAGRLRSRDGLTIIDLDANTLTLKD